MINTANRNLLWASILADELVRCGVRHVVVSPGSRSTPLAVAFSEQPEIKVHSVLDERAAAFFALGIGKASGMPAVAVCTSGTAAANYFPAIIEASESHVPLIVMTADRPHELRDSGANQTIDQVKLYGNYVRWFVDVAPPHANPEDRTLRYLRTTVDRAVAASQGSNGGPVHLNIPFEKPLEPVVIAEDVPESVVASLGAQGRMDQLPMTVFPPKWASTTEIGQKAYQFAERLEGHGRGLILVGAGCEMDSGVLAWLSQMMGYPVLADALSGVRYGSSPSNSVLTGYETFLNGMFVQQMEPKVIIQFGDEPISASLLQFLGSQQTARRIFISESGSWEDEFHLASDCIEADASDLIAAFRDLVNAGDFAPAPCPEWLSLFQQAERITQEETRSLLDREAVEGGILRDVIDALPKDAVLFVGNSGVVRHLDQFVPAQSKRLHVYANRGASGIDGNIASALGVSEGIDQPAVLVIGDVALYHDLNSLHLIRRLNIPLVIVCINNNGGGIFHRLPIAEYDPPFRDLFVTPHGLTFEYAAAMFDLPYTLAQMGEEFRGVFKSALESGEPHLIEVPSDAAVFEQQRRELMDTVAEKLAALIPVS